MNIMNIDNLEIYDEVSNYVNNANAWEEAVKDWNKIQVPPLDSEIGLINSPDGSFMIGDVSLLERNPEDLKVTRLHCDNEEPKEWRVDDGNISAANWSAINHKKINLSLYVVGAVKNNMVTNIDELN